MLTGVDNVINRTYSILMMTTEQTTTTETDNVNRMQQILAMRALVKHAGKAVDRAVKRFNASNDDAAYDRLFAAMDGAIKRRQELQRALDAAELNWRNDWT